jgi:bifunctional UDP-N-acetylglucosamine pyrophosphorylase/glucosamine-1-phosphate N-acetyltransferase
MKNEIRAVLLAAGKSSRMKSTRSKVVHRILGREIINFLLDSLAEVGIDDRGVVIVVGDNRAEVEAAVRRPVAYVAQEPQRGTAHALLCARELVSGHAGELLVSVGDNPYVDAEELKRLIDHHRRSQAACTFLSAVFPGPPPPYGRVLRDAAGRVTGVVEELDATDEQLQVREVNSSIYLFDNRVVFPRLERIGCHNRKQEYYLTDIIAILIADGFAVEALPARDPRISIGINTRWELQEAQRHFSQKRLIELALVRGVTVLQPESVTVEYGAEIGADTVIFPNVYIAAGTRIGRGCSIGPFAYLQGVAIPDGHSVSFVRLPS